jgi:hypothetical protein
MTHSEISAAGDPPLCRWEIPSYPACGTLALPTVRLMSLIPVVEVACTARDRQGEDSRGQSRHAVARVSHHCSLAIPFPYLR